MSLFYIYTRLSGYKIPSQREFLLGVFNGIVPLSSSLQYLVEKSSVNLIHNQSLVWHMYSLLLFSSSQKLHDDRSSFLLILLDQNQ